MDDIKPCPFCGHPRSRLMHKREYCEDNYFNIAMRFAFYRRCNKCGATSGVVRSEPFYDKYEYAGADSMKKFRDMADEEWNRRAGEEQ